MKILIIEDEVHNQRLLKGMINTLRPGWNVVDMLESVSDSATWLSENKVDLIFMDIQLVDGLCFSIFEKTEVQSPVVFTTAYDNFAVQAFKVNSIDYLLKPVKETELLLAIKKFEHQRTKIQPEINYIELLSAIKNGEKKYRNRILIHGAKSYFKIEVSEVAYFYSENKITFARMFNNSVHSVDATLETLEEELHPDMFFRASRNILVNINAVVSFEDYFGGKLALKLSPPFHETITVSRLKNSAFKEWMNN